MEFSVLMSCSTLRLVSCGSLALTVVHGMVSDQDYMKMLDVTRARFGRRSVVLVDARLADSNANQRRMWSEFVEQNKERLAIEWAGLAFVVNNAFIAGAVRAISWVVRPPFPQTARDDLESAHAWCAERAVAIRSEPFPSLAAVRYQVDLYLSQFGSTRASGM